MRSGVGVRARSVQKKKKKTDPPFTGYFYMSQNVYCATLEILKHRWLTSHLLHYKPTESHQQRHKVKSREASQRSRKPIQNQRAIEARSQSSDPTNKTKKRTKANNGRAKASPEFRKRRSRTSGSNQQPNQLFLNSNLTSRS